MHKPAGWLSGVTGSAITERARMSLQGLEFDRIVRFPARGNGVGAIVACLTVDAAMAGRFAV